MFANFPRSTADCVLKEIKFDTDIRYIHIVTNVIISYLNISIDAKNSDPLLKGFDRFVIKLEFRIITFM